MVKQCRDDQRSAAINYAQDQGDKTVAQTRRIRGDGQLFPFPAAQYPRQPGCPAKGDIQFRASVPGLRIGLPVGVAKPFVKTSEINAAA